MFEKLFEFIWKPKNREKYKNIVNDFFDIKHLYCKDCIRNYNNCCKMELCMLGNNNDKFEANCYYCFDCHSFIPIYYIKEEDFIFDNNQLKEYILSNDSYHIIN